ncbi:GAF domain-containing protein [Leucobacter sp.]
MTIARTPSASAPPVFRAPMRSRDDEIAEGAEGAAVERALALGLCGFGGRLDPAPETAAAAAALAATQHGERTARRIERFAEAPVGALVWTRDVDGLFRLGRITGGWRYDDRAAATACALVHVRPCDWLASPVAEPRVPAAVRRAFARGGRNWQRIRDESASPRSLDLWEESRG